MNVDHYDVEARGHKTRCWIWKGAVTSAGYGALRAGGRIVLAHRLAYELGVGPIAEGLTIDHLCRQKLCIRPLHLEPVTAGENARRGTRAKLDRDLAARIRTRVAAGEVRLHVAAAFGVSDVQVGRIERGEQWT